MFHHRLSILIYLALAMMLVLALRLAWLQGFCHEDYRRQVQDDLQRPGRLLENVRGTLYDCRNRVLAIDRPAYDLCLQYQLTQIFDARYWDYQTLLRAGGDASEGLSKEQAKRFLRREFKFSRQETDTILAGFSDEEWVPLGAIRQFITAKAQQLLNDLAALCQVGPEVLYQSIQSINDRIYGIRLARTRRFYYDKHPELTFTAQKSLSGIIADFERLIPDPLERLKRVGESDDIQEMRQSHVVLTGLSEEIAQQIEVNFIGSLLPMERNVRPVSLRLAKQRFYPYQDAACHLLGQLGPVSLDDRETDFDREVGPSPEELAAYRFDDRRGDWGCEAVFEKALRGHRGWVRYDVDGNLLARTEPQAGQDLFLTLDIELQRDIQNLLESKGYHGAVVVLDVPTAAVRAMVSVPTFDLNTFYQADNYERICHQQADLYWRNRALSWNYQPGSTIKPTILLAALASGIVSATTEFSCTPRNFEYNAGPQCTDYGHGSIAAAAAIKKSCNFYFIHCAEQLGSARMISWLRQAGFGAALLAWPADCSVESAAAAFSETPGHVGPLGAERVSPLEIRYMGIGRGALDGSILQIANSIATIARFGKFLAPTLCANPIAVQAARAMETDRDAVLLVRRAMKTVIYEREGTAYEAFTPLPWQPADVELFGKTGSTDYSLFGGFAAAKDGRTIALAVLIEVDAHGADIAAPLARQILILTARHGYLPPANE